MAKVIFETCCGCVELRVGCFVIAYLSLIGSGITTVKSIMRVVMSGATSVAESQLAEHPELRHAEIGPMDYITIASNIFTIILCFILLIGLHEEKPGLVKFYLICNVVYLVISFVFALITLFSTMIFIVFVIYVIVLAISIYLLLVIASYYSKMLEDRDKVPVYQNSLE